MELPGLEREGGCSKESPTLNKTGTSHHLEAVQHHLWERQVSSQSNMCTHASEASSQTCSEATSSIPDYNHVSEMDLPGTMIFNVSKPSSWNISYSISRPAGSVLLTYFRDFQSDVFFCFYLNKSLDLEELCSILGTELVMIEFSFSCDTVSKKVYLLISPENEFDPYINISGNLNIPENTTVGTVVYNLFPRTSDKDRPLTGTFLFDLDTADDRARSSTATLQIYVTDVDDQSPQFDYPGCVATCLFPEYTAITNLTFMGPLTVQPAPIKAHNPDTLNISIAYSFYNEISGGSSSDDNSGFFRIDQNTGTVYQLKPASDAFWPTQRILIIAEKVGSMQPPAYAVITVRVSQKDSSLDKSELPGDPKIDEQSLMPAVIAVSVVLGITVITSAIIICTLWHRYRKLAFQVYSQPMERNQEHPSTDPSRIKA
ncbi:hypothetical protein ACJMK2_033888 [Sinanodonta woodiana]|uniref:Cadherin domain-containing protein n=1 Tax=Sinanodonta woodiana TaxID=1069815 RepID=A0ABD3WPV3_SINWO